MAAFTLLSEEHVTQSSVSDLYLFLSDFKNFQAILPEDKVQNFQYEKDTCSFEIKGITPMQIRVTDKKENEFIVFSTEGLARFNFTLKAVFSGEPTHTGRCRIELSGDLNPIIKSMAEKPLGGLINTMSLRLSQLNLS